ncbi:MAG: hypothetical protein M9894_35385 [Planctomycetes bacterium]|nr:hypothetical protein [Planctomycetota bacterium]
MRRPRIEVRRDDAGGLASAAARIQPGGREPWRAGRRRRRATTRPSRSASVDLLEVEGARGRLGDDLVTPPAHLTLADAGLRSRASCSTQPTPARRACGPGPTRPTSAA